MADTNDVTYKSDEIINKCNDDYGNNIDLTEWTNVTNSGINYHYKDNDSSSLCIYFNGYSVTDDTKKHNQNLSGTYNPIINSQEICDYFNATNETRTPSAVIPEMYYENITGKETDSIKYIEKIVNDSYEMAGNPNNFVMNGGSYGTFNALVARAIANKNYNLGDKINYVSLYYGSQSNNYDYNPYQKLKEGQSEYTTDSLNNTVVFAFGDPNCIDQSRALIEKDVKEIIAISPGKGTGEREALEQAMNSNIIEFMSTGDINDINWEGLNGSSISIIYPNGEVEQIETTDELKIHLSDLSSLSGNYLGLKTINLPEGTIKSDQGILLNNIININNSLMKSDLNKTSFSKESYDSTTNVPSNETSILYSILNISAVLFKKINCELYALSEVGNDWANIDTHLEKIAASLPDQKTSLDVSMPERFYNEDGGLLYIDYLKKFNNLQNKKDYINNQAYKINDASTEPSQGSNTQKYPSQGGNTSSQGPIKDNNTSKEPSQGGNTSSQKPIEDNSTSKEPSQGGNTSSQKPIEDNNTSKEPSQGGNTSSQKPIKDNNTSKEPSSSSSSSSKPNQLPNNDKPPIVEIPEEPSIPEEPIIPEKPDQSEPSSPLIPNTPNIDNSKSKGILKTVGTLAGIGATVGTVAYATHKTLKNKTDKEEKNDDYSYETNEDDYLNNDQTLDYVEEESNNIQMSPFNNDNYGGEE